MLSKEDEAFQMNNVNDKKKKKTIIFETPISSNCMHATMRAKASNCTIEYQTIILFKSYAYQ